MTLAEYDTTLGFLLRTLRAGGWRVVKHYDRQSGDGFETYWAFTHPTSGRCIDGRGRDDVTAVQQAFDAREYNP